MRAIFLLFVFMAAVRAQPAVINDNQILARFQSQIVAALESGSLTDADAIREQLARNRHEIRLPRLETSARALTPAEIYANGLKSTLLFGNVYKCGKCDKWHAKAAGGVVLTSDGIAATNHHVVKNKDAAGFGAMTYEGAFFPVIEVLASSAADDLALVRLGGEGFIPAPLSSARVGEPVTVLSHPDRHFFTLSTGIVSRYSARRGAKAGSVMEITAEFARGSSGGPVFGPKGGLVGIVASTRSIYYETKEGVPRNLQLVKNYCVPASAILKLTEPKE